MSLEWVRRFCLALPHTTEQVQWGNNLVFKVGGKMFVVTVLEPARYCMSFKCSAEKFAELTERPGIVAAPYLARAQWVALESMEAVSRKELEGLLTEAYRLVWEKLPKKARGALE